MSCNILMEISKAGETAITMYDFSQDRGRRSGQPQGDGSNDQTPAWTAESIDPSTRSEMHELGNLILGLQYCLRQLRGGQGTDELEGVVRTGLELCVQSMASFRKVYDAVSADRAPSEDIRQQARG
jgi:hypothetical protein